MNGDLSLSGTLGGLRIANPDDEAVASPVSPPAAPAEFHSEPRPIPHSQYSGSHFNGPSRQGQYATQDPIRSPTAASDTNPQPLNQQRFMPMGHQAQQQMQLPRSVQSGSSMRTVLSNTSSSRPMSGMYSHPNHSSGSEISNRSYRLQPQGPIGVSRSTSKGSNAMMGSAIPSRQTSRSDRAHRQSQQYTGANGAGGVIPRRSSRRVPGHQPHPSQTYGSPYAVEGGPLPSSEEWKERGAAVTTKQEVDAEGRPVSKTFKKGVSDFSFGRTLGEGSYSTVLAATDRQTSREYAIKVLDKKHIIKEKKVKYVNIEKDTLNRLTDHPGIVRLYYTFQDERSLYFVLDLASGGELLGVLKKMGTFDEECARFYSAQILDSISYMHSRGIIHRDLKPENVLLDEQMHTKITDFGTAKILSLPPTRDESGTGNESAGDPMDGADTDRAMSFVGTAEYVSPELLTDKNACKASDLWAFGCILYQLIAGRPPFKAANEYLTFQKIVALEYVFPEGFPPVAKDLIERLLVLDPSKRLPIDHIMGHQFFDGVYWGKDLWRQKAPKLRPYIPSPAEPIRLSTNGAAHPSNIPTSASSAHTRSTSQQQVSRPQLRAITELPPPSQLDIDWSPVLTRNNERILKLGNLIVTTAPMPHSPTSKNGDGSDTPRKLSRFFGGNATKRKERLVLITSSARIIVAVAGGAEKKAKMELQLLASNTTFKSFQDAKGLTAFCVDTRDKHCVFEDPRATTSDPNGSKFSTMEWMDEIERAKEFAISQSVANNSYSGDSQYNVNDLGSTMSSPSSLGGPETPLEQPTAHHGRHTLRKEQGESRSRFNKRQSKSGLAAVF